MTLPDASPVPAVSAPVGWAAREHARFLADLGAARDLLRREVLVVVQEPTDLGTKDAEAATARLRRRGEEAANALAAAGVTLSALDGESGSDR